MEVADRFTHPRYDDWTLDSDVGLMVLKEKIQFEWFKGTIAPICLPEVWKLLF